MRLRCADAASRKRRLMTTVRDVARERLIARRKALGHTQASLAHAIPCERTTVARWEREEADVSAHLRGPLAEALQWSLTELDGAINGNNVLPHAGHGWWSNFVTLEQAATAVSDYEPVLVPGLLQTRDYAAALLNNDELVTRRLDRQRMITRPANPVDLVTVVDESVLLRPIGGAGVLAGQLGHLALMAERPNVVVQVLPLDAPAQPTYFGALVMLEFPWAGGLVYLEHRGGANYLDSPRDIEVHRAAFDRLRELALPPAKSLRRISEQARELTR